MKQEVSQPIVIGVIVIVVAIAVGLIYMRMRSSGFQPQTTGSEPSMQEAQQKARRGQPFYQPPPGIAPRR